MPQKRIYRNVYKARKKHRCFICGREIHVGEKYISEFHMPEWKRFNFHMCCWGYKKYWGKKINWLARITNLFDWKR